MPLFSRSDGRLIRDGAPSRVLMPYLMRGRNESIVLHEALYDLTKTRPWLKAFNRAKPPQPATLFHLFLWACGYGGHRLPGMNRFVSGGRLYQREGVWLSFAAKREMRREAPLVPVKLEFPDPDYSFSQFVQIVAHEIEHGRASGDRPVDREMLLSARLPHPLRRAAAALYRTADRLNVLPDRLIIHDPMYATVFVANLGSLGLDRTWHHLYEHGTCSLFAVLGKQSKMLFVDSRAQPVVRDGVAVRWSFDERITDAHYCAWSLNLVQDIVEDPAAYIGKPESAAEA